MSESAPAKRAFGNYEIVSQIGRGGMAEVYRAKVLSGARAGRFVALKRLLPQLAKDPEYVDLFCSEADLSKLLDHPNIIKVYEVGVLSEVYYMVMELIDGRDLAQVLKRCKQNGVKLPIDFAVFLAKTLLEALEYAHHQARGPGGKVLGVVHGDVSPSNLFISRVGEIKLGDFGSARTRGTHEVQAAMIAGKPYYLSPEALEGTVDFRADLWGAAVTLYELITLERPFFGKTAKDVFEAIKRRRFKKARELRDGVALSIDEILERGFDPNPDERFGSAADFAQALDGLFDPNIGTPLGIAAVVRGLFGA